MQSPHRERKDHRQRPDTQAPTKTRRIRTISSPDEQARRTSIGPARIESNGAVVPASTIPASDDGLLVRTRSEARGPIRCEHPRDRFSPAIRRLIEPRRPFPRRISLRCVRQEHRRQARAPFAASAIANPNRFVQRPYAPLLAVFYGHRCQLFRAAATCLLIPNRRNTSARRSEPLWPKTGPRTKKAQVRDERKPEPFSIVAREGFEPSTFGL